jgi:hypothetical protein
VIGAVPAGPEAAISNEESVTGRPYRASSRYHPSIDWTPRAAPAPVCVKPETVIRLAYADQSAQMRAFSDRQPSRTMSWLDLMTS